LADHEVDFLPPEAIEEGKARQHVPGRLDALQRAIDVLCL
jgi:hypothetical protein